MAHVTVIAILPSGEHRPVTADSFSHAMDCVEELGAIGAIDTFGTKAVKLSGVFYWLPAVTRSGQLGFMETTND